MTNGEVVIRNRNKRSKKWATESLVLTDDDSPYRRLVENPPGGDVRDAHPAVTISNRPQDRKQFLEESPIPPRLQYHIKVLDHVRGGDGRRESSGRSDRRIESVGLS